LRPDTECVCYHDDRYKMLTWISKDISPEQLHNEVSWCFRILAFLGAPVGFCVNWWRIPNDRNAKPNVFPTRAEVNGGWARPGIPEVYIFRLEEWDRVLIHECIHALQWDVSPSLHTKSCLESTLGNGQITEALFEAATELNAEWMWCVIHSPDNDYEGATWVKQTMWQQKQAHAILARSSSVWKEDTSVFAYYVLKAALAFEMEEFLISWLAGNVDTDKWCATWNKYKPMFLQNAAADSGSVNQSISMRMTNPAIENFNF